MRATIDINELVISLLNDQESSLKRELGLILTQKLFQQGVVYKDGELQTTRFRPGEWVVSIPNSESKYRITRVTSDGYETEEGYTIGFTAESEYRCWMQECATNGDILAVLDGSELAAFILFKGIEDINSHGIGTLCAWHGFLDLTDGKFYSEFDERNSFFQPQKPSLRPATKSEREKFLAAMQEAGYMWNPESKLLWNIRKSDEEGKGQITLTAGNWYTCIKDYFPRADYKEFEKDSTYFCDNDGSMRDWCIKNPEEYFRPATEDEVNRAMIFKVGDWIVDTRTDAVSQIERVDERGYSYSKGFFSYSLIHHFRPWTLLDAKNGDVLYIKGNCDNEDIIFLYKGIGERNFLNAPCTDHYCFICGGSFFVAGTTGYMGLLADNIKRGTCPANGEQKQKLFHEIAEHGYVWDIEKKELVRLTRPVGGTPADMATPEPSSPSLTAFENRLWSFLTRASLGKYEDADNKVSIDRVRACAESLLDIAREQLASELDHAFREVANGNPRVKGLEQEWVAKRPEDVERYCKL